MSHPALHSHTLFPASAASHASVSELRYDEAHHLVCCNACKSSATTSCVAWSILAFCCEDDAMRVILARWRGGAHRGVSFVQHAVYILT